MDYQISQKKLRIRIPRKKESLSLIILMFCCVCFLSYETVGGGIHVPTNVLALLAIITVLMCSRIETVITVVACLQMLDSIIQISIGSTCVSFLFVAVPIILIKCIMARKMISKRVIIGSIIAVFLGVFDISHFSSYSINGFGTMIIWLFCFVYLVSITDVKWIEINRGLLVALWVISFLTVAVINMKSYNHPVLIYNNGFMPLSYSSTYRLGDQYRALGGPNTFALEASLLFAFTFPELMKKSEIRSNRVIMVLGMIASLYFGILTFSRAFIVEVVLVAFCVAFSKKGISHISKAITIVVGIAALAFAFSTPFFQTQLGNVADRFGEGNSNRFTLIMHGIDAFVSSISSLLFGNGLLYPMNPSLNFTAHNWLIDSLVAFGILSVSYWYAIISSCYSFLKRNVLARKEKIFLLNVIPFIILICNEVIVGSVRDTFIYLFIPLTLLLMVQRDNLPEGVNACG